MKFRNRIATARALLIASLLLAGVACRAPDATINERTIANTEAVGMTEESGAPKPAESIAAATVPANKEATMEKTCGDVTFRISRGAQDQRDSTSLVRVDSNGKSITIDKPAEMADYTAVGLACAIARDGFYLVVQYGELPFGCKFCEWFYLYDLGGKQLTRSDPPILTDESLPERERQTSNTREYQDMIQKLGIEHPEVQYIR